MNAGIDWLEFKPSEIAASVAISVTHETQTVENPDIAFSLLYLQQLQKVKIPLIKVSVTNDHHLLCCLIKVWKAVEY